MLNNITIFDCTLREVGYQTGWNFDKEFVKDLYTFLHGKGIDYMELGFFHDEKANPGQGIYRFCSTKNKEISDILAPIKNYTKFSAMMDIQRPLSELLPRKDSIIDAVRILTRSHETDLDVLEKHVDDVIAKGYEVFINFTSAGYNTPEKNQEFIDFAVRKGIKSIYFADTESVFTAEFVIRSMDQARKSGIEPGIHLHDKNGTANMLMEVALSQNCRFTDITLLGLGGKWHDGNVTTEHLLNRLGITGGYELTKLKTSMIQQLIKYNEHTTAVIES